MEKSEFNTTFWNGVPSNIITQIEFEKTNLLMKA